MRVLLQSSRLGAAGFSHAFGCRAATHDDIARELGVSAVVQVKQVHGASVVEADQASPDEPADALVARAAGGRRAVGVRVADCVPVLAGDETGGDVVAIHAGWRGVVAGVVREAVGRLAARHLVAAVGPSIGPCCFEVDAAVADAIANASSASVIVRRSEAKAWVDLRAAVRAQLLALGAREDDIEDVPGCTRHEPDRFHSFRRDGAASGRMLAAIAPRLAAR